MRIALATDHAGFPLKGPIAAHLRLRGHEVVDFGTDTPDPCDYPRFMRPAAEAVAAGSCARAIVLGAHPRPLQQVAKEDVRPIQEWSVVWVGAMEVAELKADQIHSCGPDPAFGRLRR